MSALTSQRCAIHFGREAVARCPECRQYYCRECITEHEDRVICASCLKRLAAAGSAPPPRRRELWPAVQIACGLLLGWIIFYSVGLRLLALPAEFHDDKLWQSTFMGGYEAPASSDE